MKRAFVVIFIAVWAFPLPALAIPASASVPLDNWVYAFAEKLAGFGLIESDLQGTRPWSRIEVARIVQEAMSQAEYGNPPPVAREILDRLHREFATEIDELNGAAAASYIKPFREIRLDYVHQEGQPAVIAGPGVIASQFPLNTNNFGLNYAETHNLQATVDSEARLGRFFLVHWRPLYLLRDSDSELRTLEGRAALALGPFEISAGRQALWWGQGRHGTLVLSNNAKPFDMVRLTNPSPILLPWLLEYLGPFRFDVFWTRLEEERVVPEPYFAGLRFTIKPVPWFELGASRTVIFGGEGRPDVDFGDFFTILGGKNLTGDEDNSNQLAAVDLRLRLPFLWGAEVYGEAGGEDEAGGWIANNSWLVGLYLPRLEPSGRASLLFEYADLSFIDNNSTVWYRHVIYTSGYTYDGKIMGHHAGGAAKDIFGELQLLLPHKTILALSLDYEERGYDQPVREKHLQPGIRLNWPVRKDLTLEAAYALDRVDNFGFVRGRDEIFHFSRAGFKYSW